MKASLSIACVALLLHVSAAADSTHPTYTTAFAAYKKGDCKTALPGFQKYMSEDADFLSTHAIFKNSVVAAIKYCSPMPNPGMTAGGDTGPWTAKISPEEKDALQARIFADKVKADAAAAVVGARIAEDAAKKAEAKAPRAMRLMPEKGRGF